ncbi:hypothetical protein BDU57DRAFT_512487 [Ampelomyces quisqualis]|uniref:Uncharacterized protein n=1 Tax=Ampelomyces quisqualis TaxID=50730 RepID=A0A6A5QVM2_AMPQU|nr:hypothetical protein BDU57DRAFT_512487 [Ampelomyces quisqualis]
MWPRNVVKCPVTHAKRCLLQHPLLRLWALATISLHYPWRFGKLWASSNAILRAWQLLTGLCVCAQALRRDWRHSQPQFDRLGAKMADYAMAYACVPKTRASRGQSAASDQALTLLLSQTLLNGIQNRLQKFHAVSSLLVLLTSG